MLKPFLSIFEKFKNLTTATLTPKRNTVPGSLSDRWSSLATIYPLRFHKNFGRWLSYNIKRQKRWLSLASIDPLRFHEFFGRWLGSP